MANLTPAPKQPTPIKLAHGMKLRNGQMIGDGLTIATRGAAKKPTPINAGLGQRSRTAGHDVITPRGPLKVWLMRADIGGLAQPQQ
jgi:hypothetical protein